MKELIHTERVLQTQELRVIQEKELCIRVNIRELDRELCIGLSTLYTNILWSVLLYFYLTLDNYVFSLRLTCVIYAI